MGLFQLKTYILSQISHRQSHFESSKQYYFGKAYVCLGVQSHPKDQDDFGQGLTVNISECKNQLEFGVYKMCCSYMVLTNPHMKHWIQFIIIRIFMKIVKICPKSPRFTVFKLVILSILVVVVLKDPNIVSINLLISGTLLHGNWSIMYCFTLSFRYIVFVFILCLWHIWLIHS